MKQVWGKGNQKGGGIFRKKGGNKPFNLNLGIEKDKMGTFKRQISTSSLKIYCAYHALNGRKSFQQ